MMRSEAKECLCESGAGTGKALPLDAPVWTPKGPVPMAFIHPGVEVLTHDGNRAKVKAVHSQGIQPIYEVDIGRGQSVRCTEDHLWTVIDKKGKRKTLTLREIMDSGARYSLPICEPLDLEHRDVEIPAYTLGVLLGDGCIGPYAATITTMDDGILFHLAQELPPKYKWRGAGGLTWRLSRAGWSPKRKRVRGGVSRSGNRWVARIGTDTRSETFESKKEAEIALRTLRRDRKMDPDWFSELRRLGLWMSRSADKFIPEEYKANSIGVRLGVLQGLLDTDGTIDRSGGHQPVFTSVSRRLALDVRELVESLGGLATIKTKKTSGRLAYNVRIQHPDATSLFRLPRKRNLARKRLTVPRRWIGKITPAGKTECQCIEIDTQEGLFLTEHCAVTHNSFSILAKAYFTAVKYKGSRQLFLRQTRKSLNDSILPMWRDKILTNGHPAIRPTSTIPYQDNYRFPNGSEVVIGGLEDADRILSAEYDRIYIFQAEETNVEAYEKALTRLRHSKTPYHQIVLDVNPASRYHWINKRFDRSLCDGRLRERLSYRHQDNPLLFDHEKGEWTDWGREYVTEILGALTGVRRERLLFHRWVAEEGIILDNFDPAIHCVTGELQEPTKTDPVWRLHLKQPKEETVDLCYFTAGVDWGWDPDPGVISVWGYDSPRWHPQIRRYRVAEIYRTRWQREEWAEAAVELWARYDIRFFSCDRSRPDSIAYFNTRLGVHTGRNAPNIALGQPSLGGVRVPGRGELYNGIDLLREGFYNPVTKHVRTHFLNDALLDGPDPALVKAGRPTKTEDEILEWVYTRIKEDDPKKETLPDPKCDEHGIDAMRYDEALNYIKGYGRRAPRTKTWKPGTYGERWVKQLKRGLDGLPKGLRRRRKQRLVLPTQLQNH